MSKSALIIGATGAVGNNLLKEILNSSQFTRVGEFGRRTTPLDTEGLNNKEKLVQKVVDFEKPAEAGFTEEKWDVIFITMGTTRQKAGGFENFYKIDQEYVVNAAEAAKNADYPQQLVYLSSGGASATSRLPYLKSKGQTENRLASLGYSDTIVFQPGMLLQAERGESRPLEAALSFLVNPLTSISTSVGIGVKPLAKSICIAGEVGSSGLPEVAEATIAGTGDAKFTLISNKGAMKLSETQ